MHGILLNQFTVQQESTGWLWWNTWKGGTEAGNDSIAQGAVCQQVHKQGSLGFT